MKTRVIFLIFLFERHMMRGFIHTFNFIYNLLFSYFRTKNEWGIYIFKEYIPMQNSNDVSHFFWNDLLNK